MTKNLIRTSLVGATAAALLAGGLVVANTPDATSNRTAIASTSSVSLSAANLTPEQTTQLRTVLANPAQAKHIQDVLSASFGTSHLADPTRTATAASGGGITVENVVASGFDRDHLWMTASYWDVASGSINAGVAYCRARVGGYGWLCTWAGNQLKSWGSGWGWAGNRGVWAAVYTYGRVDGGRW